MFEIGDKVKVTTDCWFAAAGEEGIIRALPGNNGAKSLVFKETYAVEFPAWKYEKQGHSCGGTIPSKNGCWVPSKYLEPIKSASAEKIVITHDGKTTLARLYEGNKVVKSAEAKCSPDEKFDFTTGAQLAFERLTKEVN